MGNSKRTGRHGRRINTGKSTVEENGMERVGSMIRVMVKAEGSMAIRHKPEKGQLSSVRVVCQQSKNGKYPDE